MQKLGVFLVTIALVASMAWCQVPPFQEKCVTDAWPPAPNTKVPTYVVNLDLPPSQRWNQIAKIYQKEILALLAHIKEFIVDFNPKFQELIKLVDNDLGRIITTMPQPYADEMQGIANVTGAPLGEIVLYNIFYEIFTVCTSIVGQDANGNMLHARNLDFGLFLGWDIANNTWTVSEMLRPLILNVNFTRNGVLAYKAVSFAGFIGVFTGVKPNVFSLSMNERFEVKGGYIGLFEWIIGTNRNQSWVTFLPRDLFEDNSITYETALLKLANNPILAPCYYIVGGPEPMQGAVVTRDRDKAADVWKLGTNNTWFLAETNYDHWVKPLFIDDRITPANKCMNLIGQQGLSFAGLFNVLSSKPVLNKLTVYTALMEVKTGRVETYVQDCKDPCWPF